MAKASKKNLRRLRVEILESRRVMASLPFGAEPEDTGEFMLGRIAVTPVFLESDGSIDPSTEDWSPAQVEQVFSNIQTGLNWWTQLLATKSSVHTLEWVLDRTYVDNQPPISYEPINRNSNAYSLWVSEFLTDIGYASSPDLETNMRAFNHAQRQKWDTDWSFTIFVVNSRNDADDSFAVGGSFSRAFAFAGGLFQVVPSDRPASTFTHETGHMFWARDEYPGSGNYYQRRGYYNAQNTNAVDLNPQSGFVQQPSIMSSDTSLQTAYTSLVSPDSTLAQIGWKDSDGDGIFDVLDVPLLLEGTGRMSANGANYRFVGRAAAQALPNLNSSGLQNNITLNTIDRIEYRLNGGAWTTIATPRAYETNVDVTIPLSVTTGSIEIRAIDADLGVTSNLFQGVLGAQPDVTIVSGINGFVWNDSNQNGTWNANENGLPGATIALVNGAGQVLQLQRTLEPDDFGNGQLNTVQNGVRIDTIGNNTNGRIAVLTDSAASTGTKVFKPVAINGTILDSFSGDDQQLRARFDANTTFASIDVFAVIDDTDVRLDAYDAIGNLVARSERKGLLGGQRVTLEVGSTSPNISYVIARGFDKSFVKLDNLRFGPRSTTVARSDGSYSFPHLPAGTYNLRVSGPTSGYESSSPVSSLQTVVLASAAISHTDFGIYLPPSPWQNPTLPENVNNQGGVDPLDVLLLINEINRGGSRALQGSGLTAPPYWDPTGDRVLDPLDVLLVINYINRNGVGPSSSGSGEGEAPNQGKVLPFASFVHDLQSVDRETRIVRSTSTLARRAADGMETCGCPACSAFSCVSGEATPSLLDIASASLAEDPENGSLVGPKRPAEKQPVAQVDGLSLDEWMELLADYS
jgi:hypothetical protein